jgi:hypothetical protein
VGVEECRSIETARCAAARSCDNGITSDEKQTECERFAHDNCLHGLPGSDVPRQSQVDACVAAIRAAGACAAASGADTLAASCSGLKDGLTKANLTACEVVDGPEYSIDCSFLLAEPLKPVIVDAGKD